MNDTTAEIFNYLKQFIDLPEGITHLSLHLSIDSVPIIQISQYADHNNKKIKTSKFFTLEEINLKNKIIPNTPLTKIEAV